MITVENCTRCGKMFEGKRIKVSLHLYTERLKESGVWEPIANLDQSSVEYLCSDCFDDLINILSESEGKDIVEKENCSCGKTDDNPSSDSTVKIDENVVYDESGR